MKKLSLSPALFGVAASTLNACDKEEVACVEVLSTETEMIRVPHNLKECEAIQARVSAALDSEAPTTEALVEGLDVSRTLHWEGDFQYFDEKDALQDMQGELMQGLLAQRLKEVDVTSPDACEDLKSVLKEVDAKVPLSGSSFDQPWDLNLYRSARDQWSPIQNSINDSKGNELDVNNLCVVYYFDYGDVWDYVDPKHASAAGQRSFERARGSIDAKNLRSCKNNLENSVTVDLNRLFLGELEDEMSEHNSKVEKTPAVTNFSVCSKGSTPIVIDVNTPRNSLAGATVSSTQPWLSNEAMYLPVGKEGVAFRSWRYDDTPQLTITPSVPAGYQQDFSIKQWEVLDIPRSKR